jgi:hypothetical protein
MDKKTIHFIDIPTEVLIKIFVMLSDKDRVELNLVNKRVYDIFLCHSEYIHKKLIVREYKLKSYKSTFAMLKLMTEALEENDVTFCNWIKGHRHLSQLLK